MDEWAKEVGLRKTNLVARGCRHLRVVYQAKKEGTKYSGRYFIRDCGSWFGVRDTDVRERTEFDYL